MILWLQRRGFTKGMYYWLRSTTLLLLGLSQLQAVPVVGKVSELINKIFAPKLASGYLPEFITVGFVVAVLALVMAYWGYRKVWE